MPCVTVNVVGEPDIRVYKVEVSKTEVMVGESVEVTAYVKNYGTATGTAAVAFYLDGVLVHTSSTASWAPGEAGTVSVWVTLDTVGTHEICAEIA